MNAGRCVIPDYMEGGEGKPLIFIPGMEGAKEFWEPQLRGLSDAYCVIATSLPVWKPCLASAVSDCAGSIISLMDELGLEKAVVVGESFGGMVTQELALSHPQRLAGIILCNTMDRPRRGGFGANVFTWPPSSTSSHSSPSSPWTSAGACCAGWAGIAASYWTLRMETRTW